MSEDKLYKFINLYKKLIENVEIIVISGSIPALSEKTGGILIDKIQCIFEDVTLEKI